MRTSPSQVTTYLSCPRRWWWQHCRRMPAREDRTTQAIGTVFHAVAERWLLADDQGRDRGTGLPVDCFPDGWHVATERDGSSVRLDAVQQDLVRRMFERAVAEGVLRRLPGRQVEVEFVVPVVEGADMIGVMDQRNHEVVEDHKTVGDRRWAMTAQDLRKDPKSLCYAHAQRVQFPAESAGGVRLRVNNVSKKDASAWAVETEPPVSHAEVDEFWQKIVVPVTREMVGLRERELQDADWQAVEGPRESDACTKYNKPCPFSRVCAGRMEPDQLRAQNAPRDKTRKQGMGVFGKKRAPSAESVPASSAQVTAPQQAATAVVEPPPSQTAVVLAVKMPASAAPAVPVREAPPWHTPGCQACTTTPGINSKGLPCRACDTVSGRSGRPQSKDFRVWHDERGNLLWARADGAAPVTATPAAAAPAPAPAPAAVPPAPAAEAPKKERKKRSDAGVARGVAAPADNDGREAHFPAPVTNAITVQNVTVNNEAQAAARASVLAVTEPGFVLHINCVPLGSDFVDLAVLLAKEMSELAESKGVASGYELDAFKRRDILASFAPEVARTLLQGRNVVALGGSADLKAYVDALRPLASRVVVGCF